MQELPWKGSRRLILRVFAVQPVIIGLADLGLGPAGFLEVLDVELLPAAHGPERRRGPNRATRSVGNRQSGNRPEHVGPQQCRVPGDRCAPVVTDERHILQVQRIAEGAHVVGQAGAAVAFLASSDARWITGVNLPLGWSPNFPLPTESFSG